MRDIIIDCDPGHDDAIAILLAIANSNKLRIKGITTVGGNQDLDKITNNALKLLSYINEDIKVARGAEGPLLRNLTTSPEAHGDSGMDGPVLPEPEFKPLDINAVEFMRDIICSSNEKITIVAIAPLTNIALMLTAFPEVKKNIEMISLMGGSSNEGNVTSSAEFNIYVDPEAAKIVFNSGVPIIMSGLDVTHKAFINDNEIEALKRGGKASRLVGELLDFYSIYSKAFGHEGSPLHDPCAVAWLLNPEIFTSGMYHVDIETEGILTRGMTVVDKRCTAGKKPNVEMLIDINREAFIRMLFDALSMLDRRFKG